MGDENPLARIPEACPSCGRKLSPWERVLLSVDRALMCKGCWYRIILDELLGNDDPSIKTDRVDETM